MFRLLIAPACGLFFVHQHVTAVFVFCLPCAFGRRSAQMMNDVPGAVETMEKGVKADPTNAVSIQKTNVGKVSSLNSAAVPRSVAS